MLAKVTQWMYGAAADLSIVLEGRRRLLLEWFTSQAYVIIRPQAFLHSGADPCTSLTGLIIHWKMIEQFTKVPKLKSLYAELRMICAFLVYDSETRCNAPVFVKLEFSPSHGHR